MEAKKIKMELIRQKNSNFKGNIYHFSHWDERQFCVDSEA